MSWDMEDSNEDTTFDGKLFDMAKRKANAKKFP